MAKTTMSPEEVVLVTVERDEKEAKKSRWHVKAEGGEKLKQAFEYSDDAEAAARARFPNATVVISSQEHAAWEDPGEDRFNMPMAAVVQQCNAAGVSPRKWKACQREVGKDFKPLKMRPPRQVEKGPELTTSSFAELAAAKCARRSPVEDMIPATTQEGVPCKSTGKAPRCSELTFVNSEMAARTNLPVGPAVRLCPRPGVEGPLVPVTTAQGANDAATKFCKSRIAPKDAPIGWAGDVTLEHPEGEEEEIV